VKNIILLLFFSVIAVWSCGVDDLSIPARSNQAAMNDEYRSQKDIQDLCNDFGIEYIAEDGPIKNLERVELFAWRRR
jgi:hypothetical protein